MMLAGFEEPSEGEILIDGQRIDIVPANRRGIGMVLAKEAPYYLGAAGAALFTESISAVDAIVFLAGANVGAAAYEFALARGLRLFLAWAIKR